jgi:hypothetical protein
VRALAVAPGRARACDEAEWLDAVVSVACGEIELECLSGRRHRLRSGDVLWLEGLPVRAFHNSGLAPALLVAVSRRSVSEEPIV